MIYTAGDGIRPPHIKHESAEETRTAVREALAVSGPQSVAFVRASLDHWRAEAFPAPGQFR